jgi:PIF1 helicase.
MGGFLLTLVLASFRFHKFFVSKTCKRGILAAINKDVDVLNIKIQSQINGQLHSFKSVDSITDPNEVANYPTEFLNSTLYIIRHSWI